MTTQKCDRCPKQVLLDDIVEVKCWMGCEHYQCPACAEWTAREADEFDADVELYNNTQHIIPSGDLIEHTMIDNCICIPDIEVLRGDDSIIRRIAIHHSLDGREAQE